MDEDYQRQTREQRKAAAEDVYLGIRAAVGIRNGSQCTNHAQDQTHVIFFLNHVPASRGGTLSPSGPTNFLAPRDGYCDAALSGAIRRFQQQNGLTADGVVDPHGATLRLLNKLSLGSSQKQADPSDAAQLQKIHQLLDYGYAIVRDPSLNRVAPLLVTEIRSNIQQLEAELRRKGLPLGERKAPPLTNNIGFIPILLGGGAVTGGGGLIGGASITLGELIAIGAAALIVNISVFLIWRNTLGRLYEFLFRILADMIRAINLEVAAAEGKVSTGNCKSEDFAEFYNLSDTLIRVLDPRNPLPPASTARAWYSKLKQMMNCLPFTVVDKILAILGLTLSSGLTVIELLVKIMGGLPGRF